MNWIGESTECSARAMTEVVVQQRTSPLGALIVERPEVEVGA